MPTLSDLQVDFVSLVDRAAVRDPIQQSDPMRFLLWKRDHNKEATVPDKTTEELQAELTKAEADNAELQSKLDGVIKELTDLKASMAGDGGETEEIDKSELPEPVRAALEKAEAAQKAADERVAAAEEIAKSEREHRVTREFIAKAETYKALPFEAEKFGPVLKACSEKLTKEEFDEVERVLKAADEQVSQSDLFKSHGRSGEAPDTSPIAEAQAKAEEIRKADPTLSESAALEKALAADSDLQQRYLDSVR